MTQDCKRRFALLFIAIVAAIVPAVSCRNSAKPPAVEAALQPMGEPETYTATIVRSIEDGEHREISETQVARLGDLHREEWTEKGERLVVITRFDSGKSFFLNLNKQTYIETDLAEKAIEKPKTKNPRRLQNSTDTEPQGADTSQPTSALDFVEDDFAEQPASIDSRALPDEYVANQLCKVVEKRASFADGRTEVTKIFRVEKFSNLAIKTEVETISPAHRLKVVTQWRDIKLDASPEDFAVPANFKKVQSFSAP